MHTVCVEMLHFIGDFDADRRRDALENMRTQLSVIAELGGTAAMTPASYGMFSRRLPPFEPPRDEAGDRAVLLDGLGELGEHAAARGRADPARAAQPLRGPHGQPARAGRGARRGHRPGQRRRGRGLLPHEHRGGRPAGRAGRGRRTARATCRSRDSNRLEPGAGHLDWAALRRRAHEHRLHRRPGRGVPAAPANRPPRPPPPWLPARHGAVEPSAAQRGRACVTAPCPRAASTCAAQRDRGAARQLGARAHRPVAPALPAPVELGLRVHRDRAGPRLPRPRAPRAGVAAGRAVDRRARAAHRVQPGGRARRLLPRPVFWRSRDVPARPAPGDVRDRAAAGARARRARGPPRRARPRQAASCAACTRG